MFDLDLENRAEAFAIQAHESVQQKRKYTQEPYYIHPQAVAKMVKSVGADSATVASAFLHDVVEDTGVSLQTIIDTFGEDVGALVEMLTDISKPSDGNRKVRKELDRQHLAKADPRAKTVKLADLIDNTKSIVEYDRGFAPKYLEEKRLLLEVLKEGNPVLHELATISMRHAKLMLDGKYVKWGVEIDGMTQISPGLYQANEYLSVFQRKI